MRYLDGGSHYGVREKGGSRKNTLESTCMTQAKTLSNNVVIYELNAYNVSRWCLIQLLMFSQVTVKVL